MRGRAAPPHPTIFRVPLPPPPRGNTNNTCIGSVNVNFDIWAVKKLAGTLVISLNYENKVTVKEFSLMKVQNNAKIISLLCGDFIGSEMVGWQGDQIPDGRVPQLTYRSEYCASLYWRILTRHPAWRIRVFIALTKTLDAWEATW